MKNPYIIPAAMISAAILAGFWMLKPPSEQPQKVISEQPQKVISEQPQKVISEQPQKVINEQPQKVIVVQLPPPPQPPNISIHKAAKDGNIKAVKQHIAAGTDVNAKDKHGGAPLHSATLHSAIFPHHKEVVELLIAAGADVNAKDKRGKTPLDRAIDFKHPETAALLRKHGGMTGAELK
jgi:ankyrin repeat protein